MWWYLGRNKGGEIYLGSYFGDFSLWWQVRSMEELSVWGILYPQLAALMGQKVEPEDGLLTSRVLITVYSS